MKKIHFGEHEHLPLPMIVDQRQEVESLFVDTYMSWLKPGFHGPIWAKHWHVVHPGWCQPVIPEGFPTDPNPHLSAKISVTSIEFVGYNNCAFHLILYILLYYVFYCEWKVDMIQFHELTGRNDDEWRRTGNISAIDQVTKPRTSSQMVIKWESLRNALTIQCIEKTGEVS